MRPIRIISVISIACTTSYFALYDSVYRHVTYIVNGC